MGTCVSRVINKFLERKRLEREEGASREEGEERGGRERKEGRERGGEEGNGGRGRFERPGGSECVPATVPMRICVGGNARGDEEDNSWKYDKPTNDLFSEQTMVRNPIPTTVTNNVTHVTQNKQRFVAQRDIEQTTVRSPRSTTNNVTERANERTDEASRQSHHVNNIAPTVTN